MDSFDDRRLPRVLPPQVLPLKQFLRVCITDRLTCKRSLPQQIAFLSDRIDVVILREKDLNREAYERLACEVSYACAQAHIRFVVHSQVDCAHRLGCDALHLPLPLLREHGRPEGFSCVGTNVHTVAEVVEAQQLGADVVVASPVFAPSCKPDVAGKGVAFLHAIVEKAHVPVFALGGITDETVAQVRACDIAGACRMADYMQR